MYRFYNFVVTTTLILAVIFIIFYLFRIDKAITFINCFMCVFVNDVLFTVLYLVATILIIITIGTCRAGQVARIFATLFGILGTIDVGLLALFGYKVFKSETAPKSDGV
uniref:Proteolipid protein 2 n=2 Tax=Parasteatoda tepidariorum TaxID=114398 RepID=A0A2L2Y6K2_PARTP